MNSGLYIGLTLLLRMSHIYLFINLLIILYLQKTDTMDSLRLLIETAWENRTLLNENTTKNAIRKISIR